MELTYIQRALILFLTGVPMVTIKCIGQRFWTSFTIGEYSLELFAGAIGALLCAIFKPVFIYALLGILIAYVYYIFILIGSRAKARVSSFSAGSTYDAGFSVMPNPGGGFDVTTKTGFTSNMIAFDTDKGKMLNCECCYLSRAKGFIGKHGVVVYRTHHKALYFVKCKADDGTVLRNKR